MDFQFYPLKESHLKGLSRQQTSDLIFKGITLVVSGGELKDIEADGRKLSGRLFNIPGGESKTCPKQREEWI